MSNLTDTELKQLRDPSRDPVITDGDKYKVVLENDRVRVLEYRDSPGQRTSPHHHPDYVLCALGTFRRKFVLSDGREAVREVRAGEVAWGKAHSHIGENVGSTDTYVLIVEFSDLELPIAIRVCPMTGLRTGRALMGGAPPNKRVQRTRRPRLRAGRSLRSLCSPLKRRPLGSSSRLQGRRPVGIPSPFIGAAHSRAAANKSGT